mmetsp:Transcript_19808/g.26767  ORF Transcript_19808/g.26767 Transcript_19808/m.26767 type:complete len:482 (+) Transcript_19808:135-1580(+)
MDGLDPVEFAIGRDTVHLVLHVNIELFHANLAGEFALGVQLIIGLHVFEEVLAYADHARGDLLVNDSLHTLLLEHRVAVATVGHEFRHSDRVLTLQVDKAARLRRDVVQVDAVSGQGAWVKHEFNVGNLGKPSILGGVGADCPLEGLFKNAALHFQDKYNIIEWEALVERHQGNGTSRNHTILAESTRVDNAEVCLVLCADKVCHEVSHVCLVTPDFRVTRFQIAVDVPDIVSHLLLELLQVVLLDLHEGRHGAPITLLEPDPIDDVLCLISRGVEKLSHQLHLLFMTLCEVVSEAVEISLTDIESDIDLAHVKEISCAFHQRHHFIIDLRAVLLVFELVGDCLAVVLVIVAAKDDVDAWYFPRELLVMLESHVREGNHVVATFFLPQLLRVLHGCPLVVLVDDLDLEILEHGHPLLLRDTQEANLHSCFFNDSSTHAAADALGTISGPVLLHEVSHDPLAVSFRLHRLLQTLVHLHNPEI